MRRRYPPEQVIYLIGDGASNPWTPEIRTGAKATHVRRVLTPPHARYLNPVECHAGDLPKLAGAGEEFTTPREVGRALDRAVTYRNHERKRRGKRFRDTGRKDPPAPSQVPYRATPTLGPSIIRGRATRPLLQEGNYSGWG